MINIFNVVSQEKGNTESTIHCYSTSFSEAKQKMEKLALENLKQYLGISPNDFLKSPLSDTIALENISQGLTIRYRDDNSSSDNRRIIDLIKIEKVRDYLLFPKKIFTIIKTYKIVETESISESGSVQVEEDTENFDDD